MQSRGWGRVGKGDEGEERLGSLGERGGFSLSYIMYTRELFAYCLVIAQATKTKSPPSPSSPSHLTITISIPSTTKHTAPFPSQPSRDSPCSTLRTRAIARMVELFEMDEVRVREGRGTGDFGLGLRSWWVGDGRGSGE